MQHFLGLAGMRLTLLNVIYCPDYTYYISYNDNHRYYRHLYTSACDSPSNLNNSSSSDNVSDSSNEPDHNSENEPDVDKGSSGAPGAKDKSGSNNPFYGKKHTQESKDKISAARAGKSNPNMSREVKGDKNPFYGKNIASKDENECLNQNEDLITLSSGTPKEYLIDGNTT